MKRLMRRIVAPLVVLGAVLCGSAAAAPLIELQAVLGQTAVLQVDGARRTLRVGQTSPEGVRLLALGSASARLQVDGQTHEVPLGGRAGGALPAAQAAAVRIRPR